jgi:hypothetical protein
MPAEIFTVVSVGRTIKLSDRRRKTPDQLQQSLINYLNRSTAQRGGGSLQRLVEQSRYAASRCFCVWIAMRQHVGKLLCCRGMNSTKSPCV